MAQTVGLDLWRGRTRMTKGVLDNRYDHAVRYGFIHGLDNTNEAYQQAVDLLLFDVGSSGTQADIMSFHGIPLQKITPIKFGPDCADVILEYFRTPFSFNLDPNIELLMRARGAIRAEQWYRLPYRRVSKPSGPSVQEAFVAGRPAGDLIFPDGGGLDRERPGPKPYVWTQPGASFKIPYNLDHSPGPAVAGLIGRTNTNAVTFGEIPIAPNHIRFDDWTMNVRSVNNQLRWTGEYEFTAVQGGFFFQTVFFEDDVWQTVDGLQYPTAEFDGAFDIT